jgi:hypothetical protein
MRAGTHVDPGGVTTMPEPVSEEKQRAFFEKARKGMLAWLAKQDGATATLWRRALPSPASAGRVRF